MRQTLFYIPETLEALGGLPVFGLGLLFVIWLIGSVALLAWLAWRQGFNQDTLSYVPILLVFGAGILFVGPWMIEPKFGLPIRGYGVMVTLGVICGVGLSAWQAQRAGRDPEEIFSLAFWMFVFGILGARAFFVAQYWNQFQRASMWETAQAVADITKGGLVVYGSVLGGLAALVVFCRLRKLPVLAIGDIIAPGMLLGLAFGRLGCLLNGCCYGGLCEDRWLPAISFPRYADERARKPSDAYLHQQSLGQLHGFRLLSNSQGEAVVAHVDRDSPAGAAGLPVGSVVRRIDLDPFSAHFAAQVVPELAGGDLEVQTASGKQIHVPIAARRRDRESAAPANEIGFGIRVGPGGAGVVVQSVLLDGPAARAGLKMEERIEAIHLPPVPTLTAALNVLAQADETLILETADGGRFDVSLAALPPRSRPVHPTQIYSSIKAALLALFLYAYFPFRRRAGEVFAAMLVLYPPFRILIESIRDDVPSLFDFGFKVTISQAVSAAILAAGVALWIYLWRQPRFDSSGEAPIVA